ncbi:hypothetical protein [Flavobacterium sp. HNIBRBA15423]|uniref:hypothetical protein n=1 Tax=Flavobacterium sp. HNIBRBA15423 TaxID=3458683 RepID=UPI00404428D7
MTSRIDIKNALLFLILFISFNGFNQEKLDKKIDEAIAIYEDGDVDKAYEIWKKIENKANKKSSTYGTTLSNILYYYIEKKDEKNFLKYYYKIINSDLNDRDLKHEIGKPFKNYRYHATMRIASYYGGNKEFEKSLEFIEKADTEIVFESTSLTAYIYEKVDLAFWKYHLLKDLKQNDKAISKLIERAFEYDYKNMYLNWATVSKSSDENELAETICEEFLDINSLKTEIDFAIDNLKLDTSKKTIELEIFKIHYTIDLYTDLESITQAKEYLKNSYFYSYLQEKSNK